jgi:hypothetical protein
MAHCRSMGDEQLAAPGELEHVRRFVNAYRRRRAR